MVRAASSRPDIARHDPFGSIDGISHAVDHRARPSTLTVARSEPRAPTPGRITSLDLRRQLVIVRRLLPLLTLSVILAGAIAFIGASVQPKVYEANATLIVGESLSASNPDYNQLLASQRLSKTYASLATTRPVLEKVLAKLGLSTTPDELLKKVRAT